MTISSTTTKNSYSGNGSNTTFAYGFYIPASTDIQVIVRSSTGTETVKSEGTGSTNYSITGVGNSSGGNVVFVTAPLNTETVVLRRNTAKTQATDYVANDPFPAETHEDALDKLTIIGQDLQEQVDRSLKLSRTNTMTSTEFTVGATDRASKILAFDSSGELSVTQELGTVKGNWAASTAYVVRDIVKDTSTNNIFICLTAHTSSGSQPLTSNTDSAKWSLLVDAASATTSATNAASSATAAASSASAASTSASNASTSASTASTQATNASNSASAAATSATNAATSYDNFDDRYLGAKSSDPSADNDGDSLITGAKYFNTSNNVMMVYNGSAWQRTTPTSSDQTNINTLAASAVVTDMSMLAVTDVINDMALLADSDVIADMNTLATSDIISDLNTLATSDIVTDMNLLATSANVTNMATLGASGVVSNIATVAAADSNISTVATNISGVNSFAERYRVASSAPGSSLDEGDLYYDTTANTLNYYNGSSWSAIVADTDVKVLVSSNDSTAGFLNGKLVAGTAITFAEGNDGGNETLTINAEDPTALAIALG